VTRTPTETLPPLSLSALRKILLLVAYVIFINDRVTLAAAILSPCVNFG
jgi:hypothetical protein